MLDHMAINQLIVGYAKARDTTDAELYRELFAEEAIIQSGSGKVMSTGLAAILNKVAGDVERFNPKKKNQPESYALLRHNVSNVDIALMGEFAKSEYYVTSIAYSEANQMPEIISTARNVDEYEKRDGRWWITKSTLNFGWENEAMGKALQLGPYTPEKYRR